MAQTDHSDAIAIRSTIETFLAERRQAKLDALKDDDPDRERKHEKFIAQFQRETWLADAARRVGQIQLATHLIKAIHPNAKGSSLFAPPESLADNDFVGTRQLKGEHDSDVVGNAAALDVYKFLRLEQGGRKLLTRAIDNDSALLAALSEDADKAKEWAQSFAGITEPRGGPASHTLAKQLYFPLNDGKYHLLAPLYPTALVHRINGVIREHRFGEEAKAARQARREGRDWPQPTHDYPNLAVQKLGGTKPQNISQLNSERYGDNYLLASLPPNWQAQGIKAPLSISTVFYRFRRRKEVYRLIGQLRFYLSSLPTHRTTLEVRKTRAAYTQAICDELLQFAAEIRTLDPGWSADEDCLLPEAQKYWLDPRRSDETFSAQRAVSDWQTEISGEFAAWLNGALRTDRLPLADPEYLHWRSELNQELNLIEDEVRHGS